MKSLKRFFRNFSKRYRVRVQALRWAVRNGQWKAEQARIDAERRARPYPEHRLIRIPMTEEEYHNLPLWSDLPKNHLKTCDFGFRYRKKGGIVAEVCKGLDMDVRQWGSGMSVPDRGEIYYRAVIQGPSFISVGVS